MNRQIDTAIGLIVGGIVGWNHHSWKVWVVLFLILVIWQLVEPTQKSGGAK